MPVNDELRDAAIRHATYIERYKSHLVNQVSAILAEADAKIRAELQRTAKTTSWTKARQDALQKRIETINKKYRGKVDDLYKAAMKEFGGVESQWIVKSVNEAMPVKVDLSGISPTQVMSAANGSEMIMSGGTLATIKGMTGGMFDKRQEIISQTIRQGFLLGKTNQEITRELYGTAALGFKDGTIQASRTAVARVVRTTTNHLSSEARRKTYADNQDVIRGYQWVSTLDTHTSDICVERDGKVWIFDGDYRDGEIALEAEVYPPAHPNCRSTTVPITKSFREMGLDIDELPESTRASMDGQVPESITYKEWLEKQPASVQTDVLGPTRYNLWKDGKVEISAFYDDGRMLTLDELRKKYNL